MSLLKTENIENLSNAIDLSKDDDHVGSAQANEHRPIYSQDNGTGSDKCKDTVECNIESHPGSASIDDECKFIVWA